MTTRYSLNIFPSFERRFKKFAKKNKKLGELTIRILNNIAEDPFYSSLKTHKVDSKYLKGVYSSRLTGDLRIIWSFDKKRVWVIDIYDIGGHEGSNKVYN